MRTSSSACTQVAALAEVMGAATGDPTEDSTLIGPLANPTQFERVTRYLDIGKAEARLVCGGETRGVGTGAVVPTIFADVADDAVPTETIRLFCNFLPSACTEPALAINQFIGFKNAES
jgi:acyl-CoA reductase-like NAD-dependent aldehyde dehydrogenase